MPHWYYDKKDLRDTPSIKSGLDYETETRYRREGARFIQELGRALGLGHDTVATGSVYFHRFYMFHSFLDFPRYVTATCALFLAGKVEETPKKVRDINKTVRSLTNDLQFASFGKDPREEILTLERVLLQTIKFDLQVEHPYSALIKFAKCLKGDSVRLQKMVQMSWTFINDSLCTTLCLQWEPEITAIALMHLAGKLSKFEVKDWNNKTPDHKHWWDQYVQFLHVDVLEDICHQVLDLYSQPTTISPSNSVSSKPSQTIAQDVSKNEPSPPHPLASPPNTQMPRPKIYHNPFPVSVTTCPPPRQPGSPSGSFAPPTKALVTPHGCSYKPTLPPRGYQAPLHCKLPPLGQNYYCVHSQAREPIVMPETSPPLGINSYSVYPQTRELEFGRGSHNESFGRGGRTHNFGRGHHSGEFGRGGYDRSRGIWGHYGEGYQRGASRARPYLRPYFSGRHRGRF